MIRWDGSSYCIEDGCTQPATHERLTGMAGDVLVVELVCAEHDTEEPE
jgi:hypothetical protein